MIGKSSSNSALSFQKGFQTLNQNLTRSNATLTQRLNAQQIEIDLLQEQVNAMDSSTTEFMVASKVSLGLDQVNNTSDENKELSKKARDALDLKHPLIQDAEGKRLSQSLVEGLTTALANKQPLITETSKLSKGLVSNYNFVDIRTSTTDDTRLSVAITKIPSTSIITIPEDGETPAVTLNTTLGTFHPKIENATGKRLAQNCVEGLDTTFATYQPLLVNATDKRLAQNCVEGLVSDLSGKQTLLSTTNKLEKTKISQYYFADIQQDFVNTSTTIHSFLGVPTVTYSSSPSIVTFSSLSGPIGSVISVALSSTNVTTNNATTYDIMTTLPSGTWSGCAQFDFTKGANYNWSTTNPMRISLSFSGTKNTSDFFPERNCGQGCYISNASTANWQVNIPILFRCSTGRTENKLQTSIAAPITGSQASGYTTHQITLTLTKIAL